MDGFFGIGIGELFTIAIVALVVLGPERLPGALRSVAKFIRTLREMTTELTSQFGDEFKVLEDLNPQKILRDLAEDPDEKAKAATKTTAAKKPATTTKSTTTKPAATKPGTTKPATSTASKPATGAKPATSTAAKPVTPTAPKVAGASATSKPATVAKPAESAVATVEEAAVAVEDAPVVSAVDAAVGAEVALAEPVGAPVTDEAADKANGAEELAALPESVAAESTPVQVGDEPVAAETVTVEDTREDHVSEAEVAEVPAAAAQTAVQDAAGDEAEAEPSILPPDLRAQAVEEVAGDEAQQDATQGTIEVAGEAPDTTDVAAGGTEASAIEETAAVVEAEAAFDDNSPVDLSSELESMASDPVASDPVASDPAIDDTVIDNTGAGDAILGDPAVNGPETPETEAGEGFAEQVITSPSGVDAVDVTDLEGTGVDVAHEDEVVDGDASLDPDTERDDAPPARAASFPSKPADLSRGQSRQDNVNGRNVNGNHVHGSPSENET